MIRHTVRGVVEHSIVCNEHSETCGDTLGGRWRTLKVLAWINSSRPPDVHQWKSFYQKTSEIYIFEE